MRRHRAFRVDGPCDAWLFARLRNGVDLIPKDHTEDTRSLPEIAAGVSAHHAPQSRTTGYAMLLITFVLCGVNWPVGKQLLHELPPLSMRGIPGGFGGLLLAAVTMIAGQSLRIPRDQWARLVLYAILSVSGCMGLIGLALVYLGASETAIIGATIPVWAVGLAGAGREA
jgi:drug/metabolite transporter (DMT)-like permease